MSRPDSYRWVLITDVDDTLMGDPEAFRTFAGTVARVPELAVVLNSSRPIASIRKTLEQETSPEEFQPLGIIGAMGTEISLFGEPDSAWRHRFGGWSRNELDDIMNRLGATPHDDEFQTPFKASFAVPPERREEAHEAVRSSGQNCFVLASGASDFDITPPNAGKGPAALHVVGRLGLSEQDFMVGGDSANDLAMFDVCQQGIVVGNAREELKQRVDPQRVFFCTRPRALGLLEGLAHWGVPLPQDF